MWITETIYIFSTEDHDSLTATKKNKEVMKIVNGHLSLMMKNDEIKGIPFEIISSPQSEYTFPVIQIYDVHRSQPFF